MNSILKALILAIALVSTGCSTQKPVLTGSVDGKEQFIKLKKLEGNWQSRDAVDGRHDQVNYRITSGGNALQEVLFPGTPHEMLSVYYVEGDQLYMTHYCMLPNHPKLKADATQGDQITFDMVSTPGINVAEDEHMHRLTLTLAAPDRLIQEWTSYKDGKPEHTKTIDLVRRY